MSNETIIHEAAIHSELIVERDAGIMFASLLVSFLGCGTALQLMSQRTGTKGLTNRLLLIISTIIFAFAGIWAMHFVGMLSMSWKNEIGEGVGVHYEIFWTVFSLIFAIVAVFICFSAVGDPNLQSLRETRTRIVIAGVCGASGVLAMHYIGITAMILQGDIEYNYGIVSASIFVALFAVMAALWIFFEISRVYLGTSLWWIFLSISSAAMALAVFGMHFTGMAAVNFYWNPNPLPQNTQNLPTNTSLLVGIIVAVVVGCMILLTALWIHNRRIFTQQVANAQNLILSVVMMDGRGQILSTIGNMLPNVPIEPEYNGAGILDAENPDFKRMFKTSFNWGEIDNMLNHLEKLYEETNEISGYSLMLFQKFISSAMAMAQKLNLDISNLGMLYWIPSSSMVTIIMKNKHNAQRAFESEAGEALKWAKPEDLVEFLTEKLNPGQNVLEWLDQLEEYHERCLMPITGEWSHDRLNDVLRQVADDLRIDSELVETEIQDWRKILDPKYVRTKQTLITLVQSREDFAEVKLPLAVKAHLRKVIERMTVGIMAPIRTGSGPVAEMMMLNRALQEDMFSALYVGIYYVQITRTGLKVMLQQQGPYKMIPMVKFGRQQCFTSDNIAWLKSLCEKPELIEKSLAHLRHQRSASNTLSLTSRIGNNINNPFQHANNTFGEINGIPPLSLSSHYNKKTSHRHNQSQLESLHSLKFFPTHQQLQNHNHNHNRSNSRLSKNEKEGCESVRVLKSSQIKEDLTSPNKFSPRFSLRTNAALNPFINKEVLFHNEQEQQQEQIQPKKQKLEDEKHQHNSSTCPPLPVYSNISSSSSSPATILPQLNVITVGSPSNSILLENRTFNSTPSHHSPNNLSTHIANSEQKNDSICDNAINNIIIPNPDSKSSENIPKITSIIPRSTQISTPKTKRTATISFAIANDPKNIIINSDNNSPKGNQASKVSKLKTEIISNHVLSSIQNTTSAIPGPLSLPPLLSTTTTTTTIPPTIVTPQISSTDSSSVPEPEIIMNNQNFITDFVTGCIRLGKLLGTDKDLTPKNLDGVHILPIALDVQLLLFTVTQFATPPVFPAGYSSNSLLFVPLTAFETIHFSYQNHNNNSNNINNNNIFHTGSSGSGGSNSLNSNDSRKSNGSNNWTRNLIKNQLAINQAWVRTPSVAAENDLIFTNPVESTIRTPSINSSNTNTMFAINLGEQNNNNNNSVNVSNENNIALSVRNPNKLGEGEGEIGGGFMSHFRSKNNNNNNNNNNLTASSLLSTPPNPHSYTGHKNVNAIFPHSNILSNGIKSMLNRRPSMTQSKLDEQKEKELKPLSIQQQHLLIESRRRRSVTDSISKKTTLNTDAQLMGDLFSSYPILSDVSQENKTSDFNSSSV